MAFTHTQGVYGNDFRHPLSSPKASYRSDGGHQNLWPRPLAKKWSVMLILGTCLLYCSRMTMPICVVSMAESFHWGKIDSGIVLGGFFWGYCFTQILGGHASDRLGGERVLCISAVLWSVITAATPVLAYLGPHTLALMTFTRFLMGLLQGVFFPSLASLCSQRVVEGERGLLMSLLHGGCHLGTLVAGGMGALMLDGYGWESMFYTTGVLSGLWALVVWQCFLKGDFASKQMASTRPVSVLSRSLLLRLLKKPPVWSMMFAHLCLGGTSYTLLSWLPTYFKETFPHSKGWVYNVIPWLSAIPLAVGGGYVSDFLINKGHSVSFVRKLMQSFAMGVSSLFILLLSGASTCSSAVVFVSIALGLCSFTSGGVSINVQDLTPSCAGALFGLMNTMGAFTGLLMVFLSGYLIEVTLSWTAVYSLLVLVNTLGLSVYLLFGDARRLDLESYSPVLVV
ncbi:voltage-gated purine nucleotide uniporter SLC17A9-like [Nelusetta ayraudi]|uniref:voltage-gated purine nucleotide uniporter SLC17A9-like n=1 Tax=Nelusetta ayraudi TaxID=303726 RepID=UPI003F706D3D